MKQGVEPVIHAPRRIPHAIKDKVKAELDRMEKLGVIVKQTEPTEWVNSMVVVQKGEKLRICIDPSDLNKAIMREHHPTVTVEEVAADIQKACKLSKLDCRQGYWHISLDEESSKLCTMNTMFGRYRFVRLPFGLCSSGDVFQRAMENLLAGLDNVRVIVDDVLIWNVTAEGHDKTLEEVLKRASAAGLRLNKAKAQIGKSEVEYVGHILSTSGVKANPERIRAVQNMPKPIDKEGVHRFLGMVTYLSKFIPNLSDVSAPLRELLKKEAEFHWGEDQNQSFEQLKKAVCSSPVLKYYDVTAPILLSTDASKDGLGACIMQSDRPVAYASRSLTSAQKNSYSQLEKELVGIVFGCKRFHEYIHGKTVQVETDHKPLVSIFKKNISQLTPRVQKMILQLKRYDLEVTYKPGAELYIADTLSRAYLEECPDDLFDEVLDVNMVSSLPISERKIQEFKAATNESPSLIKLKHVVLNGWPETRNLCDDILKPYWEFRDEITIDDELLFKCA